jgi:hypothetical protein
MLRVHLLIVPSGYTDEGRSPIGLGFVASAWAEVIGFRLDR